jgi:hypothetical protein
MFRVNRIEIPETAHTIVETATGRCVDLCPTITLAEATAAFLTQLNGVGYHCRPAARADLFELYDELITR